LREAERFTQGPPAGVSSEAGRELRWWHLPEVDWPVADRLARVVKTVRIDNQRRIKKKVEVFQTITVDCHLKHPAVHQSTALVVLTMIRVLAYTLSLVFYQRQVRSHDEIAQRIGDWFVAPSLNTS